ncbi:hypothetical protein JJB09_26170 [Rhizobium sp. KVB221]|uniref:Uncharacterized protein n=1 Tax=Rhizobium setariae TaxID=2801340 RepID=A0A936YTD1_9HYPH|nr:hypothetical protein [Rhizobium setariae]MBL0375498.1 hypothetical protein [Rhizobium setariae]
MSSVVNQQHLTSMNLKMLGSVLDTAGIFDIDTKWHLERRMRFGRVLVGAFQDGVTSEAELASNLLGEFEVLHASCIPNSKSPANEGDLARWENEGGSLRCAATRGSYLFGKRIERDGTWTIHHVFSGVPAQYGTWNMQGLTEQVAKRALRTINTPSISGEH